MLRHLSIAIMGVYGSICLSSAADLSLSLESGFDSNYANAPSGSADLEGAFFTRPGLDVEWSGFESEQSSFYLAAFANGEIHSNTGGSGGADFGGGPGYRFSWLEDELDSNVSYVVMRSLGLSPSTTSVSGTGKKTVLSSVAGVIESSTTHTFRASTEHDFSTLTVGSDVVYGLGSYSESGRDDSRFEFSGRASLPFIDVFTVSASLGWVTNGSTLADYSYSGSRLTGTLVYELNDTVFFTGMVRLSGLAYTASRKDTQSYFLVGIEKELSESLSLEFDVSQASTVSNQAAYSYQSLTTAAAITLSL